MTPSRLAVALHDVEPATFERCALIRDWLEGLGVGKVTLLVIPARDLHSFADRSPRMVEWLHERADHGDTIAQHGFEHRRARPTAGRLQAARTWWRGDEAPEFVGLDDRETRRAIDAGLRLLRLAGVQPRGFVAPGYVYPAALRRTLGTSFDWWALHDTVAFDHGRQSTRATVHAVRGGGSLRGRMVPATVRASLAGPLLRLDLHPSGLQQPRSVWAVEALLRRASARVAVTYDELATFTPIAAAG